MLVSRLAFLQSNWVAIATTVWLCAILFGLTIFTRYELTAAEPIPAKSVWPEKSKLEQNRLGYTLVMVLHPHCPCSRASLQHLHRILTERNQKLNAQVLFYVPASSPTDWKKTDIWQQAAEIPAVTLVTDKDGLEAKKFGASTSGQTYIYDSAGFLKFSGGITALRGHAGENENLDLALSALRDEMTASVVTPVYGCLITNTVKETEYE